MTPATRTDIQFRPAIRTKTGVLVAFAGGTGSGKTYTALRFARGLVGPKGRIAVIDTESGRATDYIEEFMFDHYDMSAPFTPEAYEAAICAAWRDRYDTVVVDSWSHVWAGEGGISDQHEATLHGMVERAKMANPRVDEYTLINAFQGAAWRCKIPYKQMIQRLIQSRTHVVFCLRAEPKVKFVKQKDDSGRERTTIVDAGWQPICEKNFMFEMKCSFLLDVARPGMWTPIKLAAKFSPFFPRDGMIGEKSGELLAAWAAGGAKTNTAGPVAAQAVPASTTPDSPEMNRPLYITGIKSYARQDKLTPEQVAKIKTLAFDDAHANLETVDIAALGDLYRSWTKFVQLAGAA